MWWHTENTSSFKLFNWFCVQIGSQTDGTFITLIPLCVWHGRSAKCKVCPLIKWGLVSTPSRDPGRCWETPTWCITHSSLVRWLCSLTALISLETSFSFCGTCRQNLLEKGNNIPSLEENIWPHFQDVVGSGPTGYSESTRFCVLPTDRICGICLGSA